MEEHNGSIKKTLRKITPSELRAKHVYIKKEVKTTDPARFFRNLAIGIGELGYTIDQEIENKIKLGELGESAYMSTPLTGVKAITGKRSRKPELVAASVVTGVGILTFILLPVLGLLVLGLGELSLVFWLQGRGRVQSKEKNSAAKFSRIWLLLEDKNQLAAAVEPGAAAPAGRRPRVSELIVHAAGESEGDRVTLHSELKTLTDRLEFFV
jgi:hypothetical protein